MPVLARVPAAMQENQGWSAPAQIIGDAGAWYITRRFEHFLHESSNVSLNLRTEGVSTTANCGLLASLCSGSSSVRYLVETEYISLPDAKHSGLAHFSFEHSGKYLHLNVRTKTRFS